MNKVLIFKKSTSEAILMSSWRAPYIKKHNFQQKCTPQGTLSCVVGEGKCCDLCDIYNIYIFFANVCQNSLQYLLLQS